MSKPSSRIDAATASATAMPAAAPDLDVFLSTIAPNQQRPWLERIQQWCLTNCSEYCMQAALETALDLGSGGGRLYRSVIRAAAIVEGEQELDDEGERVASQQLFVALRARAALEYVASRSDNQALRKALADVDLRLRDHSRACFLLQEDVYWNAIEGAPINEGQWWGMRVAVERTVPLRPLQDVLSSPVSAGQKCDEDVWVAAIARSIRKMCPAPPEYHVNVSGCVDHNDGAVDAVAQIWQWLSSKDSCSIVILGSEGSGRTSLLDKVLLDWARRSGPDLVLIPVLNVMTEFSIGCSAEERARYRIKSLTDDAPDDVLERLKKRSRVVFVVDGFPSEMQPGIMEIVKALVELALDGATVIASSTYAVHSAATAIGKLLIKKVPDARGQVRLKRLRLLDMSEDERLRLVSMFRSTHPCIPDRDFATFNEWLRLIPEQESIGGSMHMFNLALCALDAGAFSSADARSLAEKEPYLFLIEYLLGVWATEHGVDPDRTRRDFETLAWDELRLDEPPESGRWETECSRLRMSRLPRGLRDRAALLIQWDDGNVIPTPRFRHRRIRDALVLRFLIRKAEERTYDLICAETQIWKAIRLLARYTATPRADKLVADLEQELCKRDPAKLGVAEPICWHLVVNHYRFCRVPVASTVRRRAAERFQASMLQLKGMCLTKEDAIVSTATARETALLLDLGKTRTPGGLINELIEFARRTHWVETALADITTAYYAGRTGAIVRIVEHLKDPRQYGELQPIDLSALRVIAHRSPQSAEFEAELRWAWGELAAVFETKHEEPIVALMQAELRSHIIARLESFVAAGAAS